MKEVEDLLSFIITEKWLKSMASYARINAIFRT